MGLSKPITQSNGVLTNYHRVVSIKIITNAVNIVQVASYVSKEKRDEEINATKNKNICDVFIHTTQKHLPYDQDMTIKTAYEWLKTLPEFEESEDV